MTVQTVKGAKLRKWNRGVVLCAMLVVSACSTVRDSGPAPVEKRPDYTPATKPTTSTTPSVPAEPRLSGAARSLMTKAELAADEGDYERSLALLERALRIDSDSAELYLALADIYTRKGDTAMATATAQRGMLYCGGTAQCNALRRYSR